MQGFDAGDRELPTPEIQIDDETRGRLVLSLVAIVDGATPEELAGYLEDGFPARVADGLERPDERAEMSAHVDLLLTVLPTSALAAAG
jgi:hypothetical protein